jgi:predicted PurR-regulated permease PerM
VKVPGSLGEVADQFGTDLKEMATKTLAPLGGMAGRVALGAASFLNALVPLLLVPIFTFYFLPKFPSIVRGAEELIPRRYQPWVRETAREVNRALSAWIRGQITVMGALAVLYATGLSIVGIKMAVLIGAVTGLLAFIPYVGVVVGFSLAVLVCLLEYHGPGPLVGVTVVFGAMQAVEGLFLTPYLVGEKVGLGPVGVLLALMIGGKLFGFVGVLLAVPTAAALVVLIKRGLASYKSSRFYQEGTATEENGDPIAEKMQRERDS